VKGQLFKKSGTLRCPVGGKEGTQGGRERSKTQRVSKKDTNDRVWAKGWAP